MLPVPQASLLAPLSRHCAFTLRWELSFPCRGCGGPGALSWRSSPPPVKALAPPLLLTLILFEAWSHAWQCSGILVRLGGPYSEPGLEMGMKPGCEQGQRPGPTPSPQHPHRWESHPRGHGVGQDTWDGLEWSRFSGRRPPGWEGVDAARPGESVGRHPQIAAGPRGLVGSGWVFTSPAP